MGNPRREVGEVLRGKGDQDEREDSGYIKLSNLLDVATI